MDNKKWTPEESTILGDHYADLSYDELHKILPGRTTLAIRRQAYRLKLRRKYRWLNRPKTVLSQLTSFQIGYIAGFFDGEGTFSVNRHKDKHESFFPVVIATNTNEEALNIIGGWLGIGYTKRREENIPANHATCYQLQIRRLPDVLAFIEFIKGYLIIKRRQAELVGELAQIKATAIGEFTRDNKGHILGTKCRIHPREYEIFEEVKILNKRGLKMNTNVGQVLG